MTTEYEKGFKDGLKEAEALLEAYGHRIGEEQARAKVPRLSGFLPHYQFPEPFKKGYDEGYLTASSGL